MGALKMTPNAMTPLSAELMTRGFLPAELPPCFSTEGLGRWLAPPHPSTRPR